MSAIEQGRRFCLSRHHKGRRWLPLVYFYVAEWADDQKTAIKRLQGSCQTCQRIEQRIRVGVKRRGRPFQQQQRMTHEERLQRKREAYHGMTPEQRTDRREDERIRARDRRRAAGVPERNLKRGAIAIKGGFLASDEEKRLPVRPFIEWFLGYRDGRVTSHLDIARFCEQAGISETQYQRILRLAKTDRIDTYTVPESFVDRITTALDQPQMMSVLYPDLYDDQAAA